MTVSHILSLSLISLVFGAIPSAASGQVHEQTIQWESAAVRTVTIGQGQHPPVATSISIQPGGTLVAVVGDDHVVNIYDRNSDQFVHQLSEHRDWVRSAKFSPDGRILATAGNDRKLILWDAQQNFQSRELATQGSPIVEIAFSHDGKKIATVGYQNTLQIYELATGTQLAELQCPCVDMRSVAFSTDDQTIAAAGRNGLVQLWSVNEARPLEQRRIHDRRVRALQFIDPYRLVSCGDDRQVKITDFRRPNGTRALPVHGGKLFTICVLNDGLLATGGSDNKIYIWDIDRLQQLGVLQGHTGSITCLDFQENLLVSGSFDTFIRIWTTEKIARQDDQTFTR